MEVGLIQPVGILLFDIDLLQCQELLPELILGQAGPDDEWFFLYRVLKVE